MRNKFDEQLLQLNHEMIEMGALCEEVIALSSQALTEGDTALAAKVQREEDYTFIIVARDSLKKRHGHIAFREMLSLV